MQDVHRTTALTSILCIVLLASGCASGSGARGQGESASALTDAIPLPNITGTRWSCIAIADEDGSLVPVIGEPPTLLMAPNGKVTGFAGVNRYFTSATLGNVMTPPIPLTFGPIGATRMAASPERMELERAFTSTLSRVRSACVVSAREGPGVEGGGPAIAGPTLVLIGDAGIVARFAIAPVDEGVAH